MLLLYRNRQSNRYVFCKNLSTLSQDHQLRQAGTIQFSAQVAAEVRAHSTATAERAYSSQGHKERVLSYTAAFRQEVVSEHCSFVTNILQGSFTAQWGFCGLVICPKTIFGIL